MALATLTSKGQLTIPKKIRDALQLLTGDTVEIVVNVQGEAILRPVTKKVEAVFSRLYQPGRSVVTPEMMNAAIRQRMRDESK